MSGWLTTHVLDTSLGRPAAGVLVTVARLDPDTGVVALLAETVTNGDGRTDAPLLEVGEFVAGQYEIVFSVGEYFGRSGAVVNDIPFLDRVPVRFGADGTEHLHVPLLVTPWSYSTYRGS